MHLTTTDEQQAVQRAARAFLEREITRERWQAWGATPEGYDADFWRAVGGLGWLGYGVPARDGGGGANLLDLGLLMEECGRAAAPFAIFSAVVGGLALAALAGPKLRRTWLPEVCAGRRQVALAVTEIESATNPRAFATRVRKTRSGYRLAGEKRYVLQGVTADVFLVAARDGAGVSAVLVPARAGGVHVQPAATFAGDRQSTVTFDGVDLPAGALLGRRGAAWPAFEAVATRATALLCADMLGGMQAVLDMTVRYAGERTQFGVRIGTFQAVQNMAAEMAIATEGARHVVYQTLWRLAEGMTAARELAIARAWIARAYPALTLTAHQIHGGAGFVVEHPLHRYSGRAKATAIIFGAADEWLVRLGDEIGLDETGPPGRARRRRRA